MTLHLVTAAQEEDHISSSDDARLYEAFVGSGGIVFSQGNKMSASMTDPNTMRIMDGVALLCGRYWNITNYEEVTITNGTPGMNSIALVVANIKTDPSEAVTLKVYEGVETEGEPVMPSYIEGDLNGGDTEAEMPLYAVTKTGLSVGDPMPQFEVFLSEKKFRDSISQVSVTVTPRLSNVPNTSVFDCVAYPALRLCHLEATIPSRGKAYGQGTRFTMANVDENYLPQRNVDLNCSCDGNIIPVCGLWADGQIVFTAKTGTTSATASVTISGTWLY